MLLRGCLPGVAAAEQVIVSGQVVGPDDGAISEAQVLLSQWQQHYDQYSSFATTTAADGRFSVTAEVLYHERSLRIGATKQGLSADWCAVQPGEEVLLRLGADPISSSGKVYDAHGQPLPGARAYVRLLCHASEAKERHKQWALDQNSPLSTTTDDRGQFVIEGLPPGCALALGVVAEGCARLELASHVSAGRNDIHLALAPEATISGRVTRNGAPVAGVTVFAMEKSYLGGAGTGGERRYRRE